LVHASHNGGGGRQFPRRFRPAGLDCVQICRTGVIMTASIDARTFPRPERFSPEEWSARLQLAAAYRIFNHIGWTELIYQHLSLRLPGPETLFLINPFGLHYSEVTASNLLKVDLQGNIIGGSEWTFNPAGFTPHATIHAGIPSAHCVMHTHTTAGMAVACLE